MRVGLSWVREIVPSKLDARALARKLTMAGLEVEASETPWQVDAGVVAARIVAVESHPSAEKLKICKLAIGAKAKATVVCGAPNVREGLLVAYATPGTRLAGGAEIRGAEVRGITSEGVLCSEAELGLSDDDSCLMILPVSARPGTGVAKVLGLEQWVLEVSVTPNRGDCLSVIGIAREISALSGAKLNASVPEVSEGGRPVHKEVSVELQAPDLCGRYAVRVVRGVSVGVSPFWLRHRLEVAGIRPINNVVDVTNFVMLERGQPLHAFDLSKLDGQTVVVRRAGRREQFSTLDGVKRELEVDDLVICDQHAPVALAGIMGGENSEISSRSRDVLLESAFFFPLGIRRTARRLGMVTESSYRFERGVDPEGVVPAVDRAASLLRELAGGKVCRGVVLVRGQRLKRPAIRLRPERVSQLLGVKVPLTEVKKTLGAIGARVSQRGKGGLLVVAPSHRFDLSQEVDLIEEVARIKGYERIPAKLVRGSFAPEEVISLAAVERRVREILLGQGLTEMIIPPFVSPRDNALFPCWGEEQAGQPVRLLNPLSSEEGELRQSLLPGLLRALRYNLNQGEPGVHAFSIGRVYWQGTDGQYHEKTLVAGVLYGKKPIAGLGTQFLRVEFSDAKGVVENLVEGLRLQDVTWVPAGEQRFLHPGKAALVQAAAKACALIGALHPRLQQQLELPLEAWVFELDFKQVVDYAPSRLKFRPLPRYPAIRRDVSLVVPEALPAGDVIQAIEALDDPLIAEVGVFDQYRGEPIGEGYKSLTYSIAYRADDRTLTDEEVNAAHAKVVGEVTRRLAISVRG